MRFVLTGVPERWVTISGKVVCVCADGTTITLEQPSAAHGEETKRVEIKLTSTTKATNSNVGPDRAKPTDGYMVHVELFDGSKDTATHAMFENRAGGRGR